MQRVSLSTIFWIFLRMGSVGFGGPIALISLMERECSGLRKWIDLGSFNERYVFCKLLPGPIASQMAMWMGYHVRGRPGAIVAGLGFLLPPFCLMLALSYSYKGVTSLPNATAVILGMEMGALVVIFDSVYRMFKPHSREIQSWLFVVYGAAIMLVFPRWEPLIIVLGGVSSIVFSRLHRSYFAQFGIAPVFLSLLVRIFWVHFKAGFTVFGTGLALIPILQHEAVETFHWMTPQAFIDGIAFGQITPGPVTIASVFIGFQAAGLPGAISGFIGMYLPGIILILFVMPYVFQKLKSKPFLSDFQKGAVPTVIGCILGATFQLAELTLHTVPLVVMALSLAVLAFRFSLSGWLVILLGSLFTFIGHNLVPNMF